MSFSWARHACCAARTLVVWGGLLGGSLALACSASGESPARPADRVAVRLAQASEWIEHGDRAAGIQALLEVLASTPPPDRDVRVEAHRWLGHAYTLEKDPPRALEQYELALADAPRDPWLHYAAGVARTTLGELPRALLDFDRALDLDPRHIKALQWRAEVRRDLRDPAGARADLDRAVAGIETVPDEALAVWRADRSTLLVECLTLRAQVLALLGEHELAERDRERCRVVAEAARIPGNPSPR